MTPVAHQHPIESPEYCPASLLSLWTGEITVPCTGLTQVQSQAPHRVPWALPGAMPESGASNKLWALPGARCCLNTPLPQSSAWSFSNLHVKEQPFFSPHCLKSHSLGSCSWWFATGVYYSNTSPTTIGIIFPTTPQACPCSRPKIILLCIACCY